MLLQSHCTGTRNIDESAMPVQLPAGLPAIHATAPIWHAVPAVPFPRRPHGQRTLRRPNRAEHAPPTLLDVLIIPPRSAAGPHQVAVLGSPGLGDFLCAGPAYRALRAALPGARIHFIAPTRSRDLVRRFRALFNSHFEYPGFPGIGDVPFRPDVLARFLAMVQRQELDLAVNLTPDGTIANAFLALLDARRMAGSYVPGLWQPDPLTFAPVLGHAHEIHRRLAVTDGLGFPRVDRDRLAFPVTERDHDALEAEAPGVDLEPGTYAVVHSGAPHPAQRWPATDFAAVGDLLARQGLRVVLTGAAGERAVAASVGSAMRARSLDLAGRTSLGALGALIDGARLVVTNDTGVSQLAAARRAPSVIVFLATDPRRWAPLDDARHVAVGAGLAEGCGPGGRPGCAEAACDAARERGDRTVGPPVPAEMVLDAVARQLERFGGAQPDPESVGGHGDDETADARRAVQVA